MTAGAWLVSVGIFLLVMAGAVWSAITFVDITPRCPQTHWGWCQQLYQPPAVYQLVRP